jgi:hypothetical protein
LDVVPDVTFPHIVPVALWRDRELNLARISHLKELDCEHVLRASLAQQVTDDSRVDRDALRHAEIITSHNRYYVTPTLQTPKP